MNILKFLGRRDGVLTDNSGKIHTCTYILLEPALGGDIYDYIKLSRLPENMARMYFKKLMTGI